MSSVSFLASSLVEEFSLCRDSNILLSIVPPSTIKLQQLKDTFYLAVENLYIYIRILALSENLTFYEWKFS